MLFKIICPSPTSAEAGFMALVALILLLRTYCDVWIIQNGTTIESAIICRNWQLFRNHLMKFVFSMPSISLINNLLRFGLSELKLRFRTNLTNYLYQKYMKGFTYYQMTNLDNRITNADQLLTQDVEKFCDCIADLYSNLSKPILDIFIYAVKLTASIGAQGPGYMILYLAASGLLLTHLRKPLGRMTMMEQQLEGEYRYVNSRLITNSEEIAFYQGNVKEIATMHSTFTRLVDHLRMLINFRFQTGIIDSIVAKYTATVVGYFVVSRPFMDSTNSSLMNSNHSQRLEFYYECGRMLVRMAEAIGRVVLSGREMAKLSGYTARIIQLQKVLEDLNRGRYVRGVVSSANNFNNSSAPDENVDYEIVSNLNRSNLVPNSGRIVIEDHIIKFDHVPIVTPNLDVLIDELNMEVRSGSNVIICGPNGCGKSSLFRILGGLWPIFGGTLTKPAISKLFYIPQRPYMPLGTLRDQIIYPDTQSLMHMKNVQDSDLKLLLEKVQLLGIVNREADGLDSVQDWMDVLSGGEKQRIAMARLFYHKPQFAILDECTSAVSVDVEGILYSHCRDVGITLFTVTHRRSLWKYHDFFLKMDGRGSYVFKTITEATEEFGS